LLYKAIITPSVETISNTGLNELFKIKNVMKMTIYEDRETTVGRTTYLLNYYYLQPASAALYRLTLLA
jgi:hypothetical protein